MNTRITSLLVAAGLLFHTLVGSAAPPGPAPGAVPGTLPLSSCQLQDATRVSLVPAECGYLSVPEDPANPGGARIQIRVARVPAISRRKQADPLFIIAGGPGMASGSFYASAPFAFERIHRDRDLVLVDQRGTGGSNALNCVLDDDTLYHASDSEVSDGARRCLQTLQKTHHVEFYTTSIAVRDLDAVRAALGYERINLYGVSYGTRVAQHYVRRYPEHARSVILDGVVPPQLALGPAIALNAEQALTRILARCSTDAQCSKRFGDPAETYRTLRQSLQAHAVAISLPDPTSGESTHLDFGAYHLASVLRLASYTAEQAALLPLMLNDASHADYTPLASQFLLVNKAVGDVIAYGMHNSIVCSEDVPYWNTAAIHREELEKTYLGTAQLDGLQRICAIWPRGPVDADFHAPLHSEVPALLLSGSDDPVTPPEDAQLAAGGFSHHLHLVLNGFGHGQLVAPCIDRVMARFVATGRADGLDVSCAGDDRPMPFFLTVGGPAP